MSKDEVLALVADKKVAAGLVFDEIAAAVASIEVGSPVEGGSEVEALKAEVADLKIQLEGKQAVVDAVQGELSDAKAKLAAVDALAKQIDSEIPDAAV